MSVRFLSSILAVVFSLCAASPNLRACPDELSPSKELNAQIRDGKFLLVDVRETEEFKAEHIEGAVSAPLSVVASQPIANSTQPVLIYCRSGARGAKACVLLKRKNPNIKVYNLKGGLSEWKDDDLPTVVQRHCHLSQPSQVHIAAGTLVFLGTILGVTCHSIFLAVPACIGCGLILSGVTGWCGLAQVISLLPWNQ